MKTPKKLWLAILAAHLVALPIWAANAEENLTGQDKVLMFKAAKIECAAQLAGKIKGLLISENATVANAAAVDVNQQSFVEALVQGATFSDPQYIGDNCVVKGKITLEVIVENLNRMIKTINNKNVKSFESIKKYNTQTVVEATGIGAKKDTSASESGEDDTGEIAALGQLSGSGQQKAMALKAARIDALVDLAWTLKGVRISEEATVFNAAAESWIQATTDALVQGAEVKRYIVLAPDLVLCKMEITLNTIVENIKRNTQIFSNGREVTTESIKRYNGQQQVFVGKGTGAIVTGSTTRRNTGTVIPGSVR